MRATRAFLILLLLSGAASGCYPGQIVSSAQAVSTTTLVDSQTALKNARTFALPDTIFHSMQTQASGIVGREGDAAILASIRAHFIDLGWREITDITVEHPDVVVLTAVNERTESGVAYTDWWGGWGYWPGWPPAYGPTWGWGYPVGATTFTYEVGTLIIAMLDIQHGNTSTRRIPLLWAGAVNGVLVVGTLEDALAGINQAFAQSPYLERP